MNASSSSKCNARGSGQRPCKRARYSFGSKYRQKAKILKPCLGFENQNSKPEARSSLLIDDRFFPHGIQPGTFLELKGPEKSGKSFFLTYIIARVLLQYPDKKVLFVDTRHKFNLKSLVSIICHFDPVIGKLIGKSREERQAKLDRPYSDILKDYPQLFSYLERVKILHSHTPEDLMLIFGPPGESVVQNLLLQDTNVCLVVVDSIDNYSYSETMSTSSWAHEWPSVMHLLRNSVSSTRCPVVCTTLIPMDDYVYKIKRTPSQNKPASGSKVSTNAPSGSNEAVKNSIIPGTNVMSASTKTHNQQKETGEKKCISNFIIEYILFTMILELNPVKPAEKERLEKKHSRKLYHCVESNLRSRHNANTAGSGGNHRVKFSIFSDMLWLL